MDVKGTAGVGAAAGAGGAVLDTALALPLAGVSAAVSAAAVACAPMRDLMSSSPAAALPPDSRKASPINFMPWLKSKNNEKNLIRSDRIGPIERADRCHCETDRQTDRLIILLRYSVNLTQPSSHLHSQCACLFVD